MPTHRKSTGTTPFDSQTLGELYETYAPQLLRICLRYVKNQAEAEDVLHDAFVIIFTHIDALRDETKLVHWMTVIVRNLALRHAKATEERLRLHEAITEELADDDSPPPSSVVPMERLLEAIETLPRGYGEVFSSRGARRTVTRRGLGNCWALHRTVRRRNWHVPNAC